MISFLIIISLSFLPNLIDSTVPFVLNPACNISQCNQTGQSALYYANQLIGDKKIHMIYSSFDELTLMIMQTGKNDSPIFNYDATYSKNYSNSFQFDGTKPVNSLTLILRRLIEFNDTNQSSQMDGKDNTMISYYLNNATLSNATLDKNTNQPSFEYRLDKVKKPKNISFSFNCFSMCF
jgi:hypothetical protein